MLVEIRRRLQDAKLVCAERRHGAMPAWAMSAGEVLREELAAVACFFCCSLLLLLQVLLWHEGTNTRCRVPEGIARQRQRCLNGRQASLVYATLGRSLANPNRPEKFWPTECSGRVSFHPSIYGSTSTCFPNVINLLTMETRCSKDIFPNC